VVNIVNVILVERDLRIKMGARRAQLATKGRNSRREQRPIANRFTRPNRGKGRSSRSPAPRQEAAMTQPYEPTFNELGGIDKFESLLANLPAFASDRPKPRRTPRTPELRFPTEALEQYHRM
jgi:hypothetical protein